MTLLLPTKCIIQEIYCAYNNARQPDHLTLALQASAARNVMGQGNG